MDANLSSKVIENLLDQVDALKKQIPSVNQPGRLGNPDTCLATDPRADPRLVACLKGAGFDQNAPNPPQGFDSTREKRLAFAAEAEGGYHGFLTACCEGLREITGVDRSQEVIKGVDGNDITLFISKPASATGELPCVVHIHGGGYAILKSAGVYNRRWCDSLAKSGLVVVAVEYRNTAGELGSHEYPAQLNDLISSIEWAAANRAKLGTSDVLITNGESAGGNGTLATALRLKKEGKGGIIKGCYAMCPWITGPKIYRNMSAYPQFRSYPENDGYFVNLRMAGAMATLLDASGATDDDPLLWPWFATEIDCKGLPPTVISVNELDPLRDEGLLHAQKLMKAGVRTRTRVVCGTVHAGDMWFEAALPDVYAATVADIKHFVDSL